MAQPTVTEKRQFERIPCFLEGDYKSSDEKFGQVLFQNISVTGAGIRTISSFAKNTRLLLSVVTKKLTPLVIEARVQWCKRADACWQIGIVFSKPMLLPFSEIM